MIRSIFAKARRLRALLALLLLTYASMGMASCPRTRPSGVDTIGAIALDGTAIAKNIKTLALATDAAGERKELSAELVVRILTPLDRAAAESVRAAGLLEVAWTASTAIAQEQGLAKALEVLTTVKALISEGLIPIPEGPLKEKGVGVLTEVTNFLRRLIGVFATQVGLVVLEPQPVAN